MALEIGKLFVKKNATMLCGLLLSATHCFAQEIDSSNEVYVDPHGVMRWNVDSSEVKGFGVNYTLPFAHAYRMANRLGLNPKEIIDNDVYHFTRLGFDLYRIHVWDTEISDSEGNLIENDHLDIFDYLLDVLSRNNINYVITPIAYWGNGWPEPNEPTSGFSQKFGKQNCLTNVDCIEAQKRYLNQFLNHSNPYNGKKYRDDPNLIAFEISNEPHHWGEPKKVTEFVREMVEAMRRTGTKKTIFYNISHGIHFAGAYFDGEIQGGTFQWYPTGLGYQKEIPGNVLPNVDNYNIPFESVFKERKGAKLVYEFDAADVSGSYVYPAMARSFREAGIQIATHFSYDPTFLAPFNTEYNTHYMNLAYTPKKALALKICSEIFHEIPLYADFGKYPNNRTFSNFLVDNEQNLAVYNTDEKFFYTNTTSAIPKNELNLEHISGYKSSPLVKYEGRGAYFLDKIEEGIWRLELMPDALPVDDPYGKNSMQRKVTVIKWNKHKMKVLLKELGETFNIQAVNRDNNYVSNAVQGEFLIAPGTYILSNVDGKKWSAEDDFGNYKLGHYYAPKENVDRLILRHEPIKETSSGSPLHIEALVICPDNPKEVKIVLYGKDGTNTIKMESADGYLYTTTVASEHIKVGYLNYHITVTLENGDSYTFPENCKGLPGDWDFNDENRYGTRVVSTSFPIHLFEAAEDSKFLVRPWRENSFRLLPTEEKDKSIYEINIDKLFVPDNENLHAKPIFDFSLKHFILDKIRGRKKDLSKKQVLVI
ncbi:MAG: cellulase family glycosylhydrolase, partial [Bacteroidota bacterium]